MDEPPNLVFPASGISIPAQLIIVPGGTATVTIAAGPFGKRVPVISEFLTQVITRLGKEEWASERFKQNRTKVLERLHLELGGSPSSPCSKPISCFHMVMDTWTP